MVPRLQEQQTLNVFTQLLDPPLHHEAPTVRDGIPRPWFSVPTMNTYFFWDLLAVGAYLKLFLVLIELFSDLKEETE